MTSRLDYANSLLYGASNLNRLQKVQNFAARIITKSKRFEHITPILKQLHWLPVAERIVFKVLVHTFNCLHGTGPEYLSSLLKPHTSVRGLRSAQQNRLLEHLCKTTYGLHAFINAAPHLWNRLPLDTLCISVFKNKLKSHLFVRYYQ